MALSRQTDLSLWPAVVAFIGGLVALLGTYWDDAWHTDLGRDTFWSPPHLLLYGGISLIGLVIAGWAWSVWRRRPHVKAVTASPGLMLALVGVVVTLGSAPVDDLWHKLFGRDAVIWSPPHMLGVIGVVAIAGGLLLQVSRLFGTAESILTALMASLVLGAFHVVVMEYESDVPQFAVLWYLPVLATTSGFAFALARAVSNSPWISTVAAAIYTLMRAGAFAFVAVLGHSLTFIPPILVAALVFDLTGQWKWPGLIRAAAFTGTIYLVYVPYLNNFLTGIQLGAFDIIVGLPLATLGVWAALRAVRADGPMSLRAPVAALLTFFAFFVSVGPATAHDPGQGQEVGRIHLVAVLRDGATNVSAEILEPQNCSRLEPRGVVARRAGEVPRASLLESSECRFEGRIVLPDRGRWFVYVELTDGENVLESWLPVIVRSEPMRFEKTASLYRPEPSSKSTVQLAAGSALYIVFGAVLAGIVFEFRRQARQPEKTLSEMRALW